MSGQEEVEEKFAALRDVTRRFGSVHEEQLRQLRLWPHAILRGCASAEAEVDVGARRVVFRARFSARTSPTRTHLKRLAGAVRWLFGAEWSVEIARVARDGGEKSIYSVEGSGPSPTRFAGTDFEAGRVVPAPWTFPKHQSSVRPEKSSSGPKTG